MRRILLQSLVAVSCGLLSHRARADDALYRCEAADGSVIVQGVPCPKGVSQRKIPFERPVAPVAAPSPAPAPPSVPQVAGHPVTPVDAMHGPNDPYPLWQCMRADGSTYDSRDGKPGRNWVPNNDAAPAQTDVQKAEESAKMIERVKKGEHVTRLYNDPMTTSDGSAPVATNQPPAGAAPGQWVADQCVLLDPVQTCERFAARRDALRKQIYAAKPSERSRFAPEEQDLTSMLFAACGR